jgi:hypothetical protein
MDRLLGAASRRNATSCVASAPRAPRLPGRAPTEGCSFPRPHALQGSLKSVPRRTVPWNVAPPYVLPARRCTDVARSSSPCPRYPSPVLLLTLRFIGAAVPSPDPQTPPPPNADRAAAGVLAPGPDELRLRAFCKPSSASLHPPLPLP